MMPIEFGAISELPPAFRANGTATRAASTTNAATAATTCQVRDRGAEGWTSPSRRSASSGSAGAGSWCSVDLGHGQHVPPPIDALQRVGSPVLEPQARSCDQVLRRGRDEDVARSSQRHHAGPDHHRHATELAPDLLTFAEVDTGADLDAQLTHRLGRGTRASDRRCRLGETRVEAVASCIELFAPEPLQLAPNDRVMAGDQLFPSRIPEATGHRRGVHDVGEQDRSQHARTGSSAHGSQCALLLRDARVINGGDGRAFGSPRTVRSSPRHCEGTSIAALSSHFGGR